MSFRDRLRPASFISPEDETEHFFEVNSLERSKNKKGSTQEILDSNESISQDQGNTAWVFPVNAYFTGADYDQPTDSFVEALSQKYTQASPGILKHPRWGDITVFPFSIVQKEELVDGAMVGRVDITFREVFPEEFPTSDVATLDEATSNITEMEVESQELSKNINVEKPGALTNVLGKVSTMTGAIKNTIGGIVDGIEGVQDQFDAIQSAVNDIIDAAGSVVDIIAGMQRLIRTPGRIFDQTLSKIEGYSEMVTQLLGVASEENGASLTDRRNNAITMQLIAGFGTAVTAEAAATTEFQNREQAVSAINIVNDTLELYNNSFQTARTDGSISEEYSGDHNFYALLNDTVKRVNAIILNQAFNLKIEKKFILKTNSDPIIACYNNYGTVDNETMDFFIKTNNLKNDEFYEIPAGREIVIYV